MVTFLALYTELFRSHLATTAREEHSHVLMQRALEKGRSAMANPVILKADSKGVPHSNLVAEPLASVQGQRRCAKVVCGFCCKWIFGPLALMIFHAGLVVYWLRGDFVNDVSVTTTYTTTGIGTSALDEVVFPYKMEEAPHGIMEEEVDELGNPSLELWQKTSDVSKDSLPEDPTSPVDSGLGTIPLDNSPVVRAKGSVGTNWNHIPSPDPVFIGPHPASQKQSAVPAYKQSAVPKGYTEEQKPKQPLITLNEPNAKEGNGSRIRRPHAYDILTRPPGRLYDARKRWSDLLRKIHARYAASMGRPLLNYTRRLSYEAAAPPKRTMAEFLLSWVKVGGLGFSILYMVVCLCCMYNPNRRGPHVHTSDAGPPFIGTATLKCPPSWCIEKSHIYTLRSWVSDLVLWSTATEVPVERQAAIAALQITGSARELIREIPPEQLRDGFFDPQTQQQLTGLMVLVQHLARRYAPMEQEVSTKAISELLNFVRLPHESVDELLVRFDILRNRAQIRGGLGINIQGLSWMLLRSLQVGPEEWDKFLHFNGGQLPNDQQTMNQLIERLRRYGHLQEGAMRHGTRQGGTGDPGNYYFPTFGDNANHAHNNVPGAYPASAAATSSSQHGWSEGFMQMFTGQSVTGPPSQTYLSQEDGLTQCSHCQSYYDEEFSSGTDSDSGTSDQAAAGLYQSVEVDGEMRSDESAIMNQVYQDYIMAKKRWRRMSGRPPRRYRKFNYKQRRHVPHLQRSSFRQTFAAFLPPNAFAAGKGHGKGGNKGASWRKNPRGRDGKPLKCLRCGSEEHLFRRCPQVVANQGTRQDNKAFMSQALPAIANPPTFGSFSLDPSSSSAMFHAVVAPSEPPAHYHLSTACSVAGSAVSDHASLMGSVSSNNWREYKGFEIELEKLRSVSQTPSEVGSNEPSQASQPTPVNQYSPPTWEPSNVTGADLSEQGERPSSSNQSGVECLVPGAPNPAFPPPARAAPRNPSSSKTSAKETAARKQVVKELSSLMYPWWEVTSATAEISTYHLRTRLTGNRVGLLVDPGAHDNLAGASTMQRLGEQIGVTPRASGLSKKLTVEGVGKDSQQASQAWEVPICLKSTDGELLKGKFRAPVIPGSTLPPLLGLKALREMRAVIDCAKGTMTLPGPGDYEMKLSPGSRTFQLEVSESGHLILPLDHEPIKP